MIRKIVLKPVTLAVPEPQRIARVWRRSPRAKPSVLRAPVPKGDGLDTLVE